MSLSSIEQEMLRSAYTLKAVDNLKDFAAVSGYIFVMAQAILRRDLTIVEQKQVIDAFAAHLKTTAEGGLFSRLMAHTQDEHKLEEINKIKRATIDIIQDRRKT